MWFSIEHEVPGRVRVRLSGRIAARDVDPLATVVMSAPGARDVRIYPRTGSVAVSYEPVGDARSDILAYLRGIDQAALDVARSECTVQLANREQELLL